MKILFQAEFCFCLTHAKLTGRFMRVISITCIHFCVKMNIKFFTHILGRVRMFNLTFNNISVISRRSDLLVEETGVPGENHRHAASHWQTLSHNVVSSTTHLSGILINLNFTVGQVRNMRNRILLKIQIWT